MRALLLWLLLYLLRAIRRKSDIVRRSAVAQLRYFPCPRSASLVELSVTEPVNWSRPRRDRLPSSLKWSAETRQRPHGNEIDADQRLDAGDDTHPTLGAKAVFTGLHTGDPISDVEVMPPEIALLPATEADITIWWPVCQVWGNC